MNEKNILQKIIEIYVTSVENFCRYLFIFFFCTEFVDEKY